MYCVVIHACTYRISLNFTFTLNLPASSKVVKLKADVAKMQLSVQLRQLSRASHLRLKVPVY